MKYRTKICFLVDKNSVVHSQEIQIKEKYRTYIIESGLTANDKIYSKVFKSKRER
jgi:hypothetical protein